MRLVLGRHGVSPLLLQQAVLLVEQGVRVHSPDAGVVALSMVVSGPVDVIKAAAAELTGQYHRSGPVVIEGEDDDEAADDAAYLFVDLDSGDA